MMKKLLSNIDPNIWLILAFSIFAWGPLLTPAYFFEAHDARHSVFFLVEFDQTFRDGFWWPRWTPDFAFGYGYPLFNLYSPLAFYAAELLHLVGLSLTTAIKTMYVLATIGAGLGMYVFVRRLYGSMAGLVAAIAYMYVPFHLVEIFVRSAYAEYVALALIPLVFMAFTELIAKPTPRRVALAGLAYGLLPLTHHTSFFTFTPFLMIYILYLVAAKARFNIKSWVTHALAAAGAGLLGLALAAIYLIPVIAETRYIKVEQWTSGSYNYLQHFVYFSQLFEEGWGYGYAGPGAYDDFSLQLGIVIFGLAIFAVVFSLYRAYPHRNTALFFMASTLMVVLLMSPLAAPLWQILPIAALVQFPWRLLAVTAFTLSVVSGSLIPALAAVSYQPSAISGQPSATTGQPSAASAGPSSFIIYQSSILLLVLIIILGSFAYTTPQYTEIPAWAETPLAVINWDRASIIDRVGMMSATDKQPQTSPMETQYLNGESLTTAGIIAGQGTVEILHHGGASDRVRVVAEEPITLQFYTYDYPGWRVTLDDQAIDYRAEPPYGLVTIDLPAGEHIVQLRMGGTPARTAGTIITVAATIIIIGLFFWSNVR
ncbi:MAG: hypothetical protein H6633_18475 [Anaerolineales bacterium]|nr:hypothetical protein [Anaerolineales bacterium]